MKPVSPAVSRLGRLRCTSHRTAPRECPGDQVVQTHVESLEVRDFPSAGLVRVAPTDPFAGNRHQGRERRTPMNDATPGGPSVGEVSSAARYSG